MRVISFVLVAALAALSSPADACDDHAPAKGAKRHAAEHPTSFVTGQVREVDAEDGTITLAHGKIASLRMQPMSSMVFKAGDARAIAGLKPGDNVGFRVEAAADQPTLAKIELAKK